MNRYERVFRVPAVILPEAAALKVGEQIHLLAEQRIDAEMRERLRNIFRTNPAGARALDPAAADENDFVERNYQNDAFRSFVAPAYAERYTFLAPSGNVQFIGDDWELKDIPKDIDAVFARADGPQDNFIDVQLKARFRNYNELDDDNVNRVIVHGSEVAWVNHVYTAISEAVKPEQDAIRNLVYKYMVAWTWLTFALTLFLEYKAARILVPGFSFNSQLSSLAVLVIFSILFANIIIIGNFFVRVIGFLYPYFEFPDNLSRRRTDYRRPIAIGIAAAYGAALLALFTL